VKTKFTQRRIKARKESAADNPSPFALVQTAIALCQLRKKERQGYDLQPAHYFPAAKKLLDEAKDYLSIDRKKFAANAMIAMDWGNPEHYARTGRTIPFEVLLRRHDDFKSGGNNESKKHRTWVGAITTQAGLEKAIRRYFDKLESTRIIGAKAMTRNEWNCLLENQGQAVQQRAAKRVKGASSEKIQSA